MDSQQGSPLKVKSHRSVVHNQPSQVMISVKSGQDEVIDDTLITVPDDFTEKENTIMFSHKPPILIRNGIDQPFLILRDNFIKNCPEFEPISSQTSQNQNKTR